MSRDASFWRNVTVIGIAHVVVLLGLARWSGSATKPVPTDILWMDASAGDVSATSTPGAVPPENPPEPTPDSPASNVAPPDELIVPPVKSELELPAPTPTAAPSPQASSSPIALPKNTPKPISKGTPKPTPKKTVVAKASPTPRSSSTPLKASKKLAANPTRAKPQGEDSDSTQNAEVGMDGTNTARGRPSGSAASSQPAWYGSMLHDRFFGEWVQPKTALPTGAKMSTLVQLRIESDGRVSIFTIARSSGNIVVDESVAAVAKRVTRVDPPPAGLAIAGHYDVKINFELSVE